MTAFSGVVPSLAVAAGSFLVVHLVAEPWLGQPAVFVPRQPESQLVVLRLQPPQLGADVPACYFPCHCLGFDTTEGPPSGLLRAGSAACYPVVAAAVVGKPFLDAYGVDEQLPVASVVPPENVARPAYAWPRPFPFGILAAVFGVAEPVDAVVVEGESHHGRMNWRAVDSPHPNLDWCHSRFVGY